MADDLDDLVAACTAWEARPGEPHLARACEDAWREVAKRTGRSASAMRSSYGRYRIGNSVRAAVVRAVR